MRLRDLKKNNVFPLTIANLLLNKTENPQKLNSNDLLDVICPCCHDYRKVKLKNFLKKPHNKCKKCSSSSSERREKIKRTSLLKYGVDNPLKNEKVRQKIKETKTVLLM